MVYLPEEEFLDTPPPVTPAAAPVAAAPVAAAPLVPEDQFVEPAPQAAPAATPVDQVPAPGLGGVAPAAAPEAAPIYSAAPPPEPAAAPGDRFSGVMGAGGEILGSLGEAKDAALRLDPAGLGTALTGLAQKASEYEVPRLTEHAAGGKPITREDVWADPSVLIDLPFIAMTSPDLLPQRDEGGLLEGVLPEGAPGVLGEAGDVAGGVLRHDVMDDVTNVTGTRLGSPSLVGTGKDVFGSTYDEFLQTPAGQAALGHGAQTAYDAWIHSGGGTMTTPPEWNNPAEGHTGGPLEQVAATIKDLPAFGGDIVESMRSGSIGPFLQGVQGGMMADPLLLLEMALPASKAALGVGAARAGRRAAAATAVGNIDEAARATRVQKLLSTGQTGVQLLSTGEQLATGDPTALMDLGTIKRGLTAPTAEGQRLIQEQAQMTTTGDFLNALTEQRAAGTAPTSPYQAVPPAAVTPGAGLLPPNGSVAPTPVPNQPAAGAPPYQPVAPGQVPPLRSTTRGAVSPTTGAPLTPEVRNATIAAAQKHLRKRGLTDINVDVVPRLTDISPTARSTDAALWRSRERLIALQVDALDDAAHYLDHEAIHAIDDSGYWRGTERQTLLQAALDTPAVRERVDAAYDDLKKAADPYRYESELLAELYTAHRANPNLFAPEVRSILDRLVEFLKALGGAVRETTPAEVLRRIDNGEVGRRSRQQADAAARVYHGSGQRGLTTLRADIPLEERNYPNAASTLGVFTTPNENVARSYQGATGGPVVLNPKTGKYQRGALYTADVDLKRPVMMDKASFYGQFVDSDPAAIARAAEFKRDAIARGHDGVYVYDERTGNHEIVTFADLPVEEMDAFSRRVADPAADDTAALRISRNRARPDVDIRPPEPTNPPSMGRILGDNPRALYEQMDSLRGSDFPGPMGVTQAELDAAFQAADQTSGGALTRLQQDGHALVDGKLAPLSLDFIHQALTTTWNDLLWYEEWTRNVLSAFNMPMEGKNRILNLLAAHSSNTAPKLNMVRGLATEAEWLQGRVHGAMGYAANTTIQNALIKPHLESIKQYSFAGTPKFLGGLTDTPPPPTLDARMAEMLGFTGKVDKHGKTGMANGHFGDLEVYNGLAEYFTEIADVVNQHLLAVDPGLANLQSWNIQSALWTEWRRQKGTFEDTSSFIDELPRVLDDLEGRGVPRPPDDVVTQDWLRTPGLIEALSANSADYVGSPAAILPLAPHVADSTAARMRTMAPAELKAAKVPAKALADYDKLIQRAQEAIDTHVAMPVFSAVAGRQTQSMRPRLGAVHWKGETSVGVQISSFVRQYRGGAGSVSEVRHVMGEQALDYIAARAAQEAGVPSTPIISKTYVEPGKGDGFTVYLPHWEDLSGERAQSMVALQHQIRDAGYEVVRTPMEKAGQLLTVSNPGNIVDIGILEERILAALDIDTTDVVLADVSLNRRDILASSTDVQRQGILRAIEAGNTEGTGNVASFGRGEFGDLAADPSKTRRRGTGDAAERIGLLDYADEQLRTITSDLTLAKDDWHAKYGSRLPPLPGQPTPGVDPADAFARRQPGPQTREEALTEQHLTGAARELMRRNTALDARTGYMGLLLAPQTTLDMQTVYPHGFHFNDGKRVMGKELGETAAMLQDEVLTYIDMVRDPVLQQADPKEFERLTKRLVRPDQPVDFAAMGGPGNLERKGQLINNYTNGVLAEAIHKAQPKTAKNPTAISAIMKPVAEFTRVRAMVGLFNIANIPRYFLQNWMSNLLMTALRNPGAVAPYLERLTTLRKTAGVVKGTHVDMYDDLIAQAGIPVIPTVNQTDKAQLGITTTGKLPPPKTKLEAAARKVMNETATAYAQTADIGRRRAVAQAVLETGYQIQNANLPRIVAQNADGLNPVLPYRHGDYQKVVREFLATKSTRVDGNTGKMHTTLWGRPAKYTPVYTPIQARDAIRDGLLAIDSNVDRTSLNRAVHGIWQDLELSKQILTEKVRREVINADASWIPTNISEFASQIVMYPYWTTTAGVNYLRFMTTHPLAAATYGRMLDYQEQQAEVLGTPEWMRSFFRVMNSPMGMTVWLNPLELLTTFFTFPEYAEGGSPDYLDLTPLGRGASDIPFMLNSLLSLAIYATGAGGSDYRAPDVLGLGRLTGSSGALLNAANANGLLPSWMGKDAAGNPVPINTRPLEELTARFGHELSSRLQAVTGLTPVPVPNMTGGPTRDITIYIEQDIRRANPNLEQIEVNKRVTDVLEDPGSPEYQHAYQTMTSQALTMGGIDTPLPDGLDAAIEAALRLSSPIGVHAGPEQLMLDARAPGMTPSGDTPGRIIPNLDSTDEQLKMEADAIYNDAKYGASRTLAARQFDETVTAYWDGRDPDNIGPIAQEMWGIYNVDGKPGQLEKPAIIGGVEWTEEELLAIDKSQRRALAEQYASEHGTTIDALAEFGDQKDAYDDEARKNDPFLGGYLDFRDNANWKAGVEPEVYIQQTMMMNPAYGEWVMEHGLADDGSIDVKKSLTSDAYLASRGIAPSVYSPVHSVATMGPGGPVAPIVTTPAAAPPTVVPTADLNLRTGPDKTYESLLTLAPGTPLTVTEQKGEWTQVSVPGTDYAGWVATGFLQNGHSPNGVPGVAAPVPNTIVAPTGGPGTAAPSIGDQIGGAIGGAAGAVGSLIDSAGAVVGSMFGAPVAPSKPVATGVPYDVVTANDGMGVQSTIASDRTWMEDMIGPGHAYVSTDYKGPPPAGVSYEYQNGHGADGSTHAAYDITCDDPNGNCAGTPMFVPIAGTVVCGGHGTGTSTMPGASCNYSLHTTHPGLAHTITLDVGTDAAGNALQTSFNHMGESSVTPGQVVNVGDPLGTMGDTDGGPHVHLEAWANCGGTYRIIDPQLVVGGYFKTVDACA